jgi:hypothetical protein
MSLQAMSISPLSPGAARCWRKAAVKHLRGKWSQR